MYVICASSTCALPSRLVACWAKMSRISQVRSMTLTLTISSRLRSWPGLSSPSQMTVSAPEASTASRSSLALPEPTYVLGSGFSRRWARPSRTSQPAVSASACSSLSEFSAPTASPYGVDAHEHDPLEAQLAVLDLGDVLEVGADARDPAQAGAGLEVEALALEVVQRTSGRSASRWIASSAAGGEEGRDAAQESSSGQHRRGRFIPARVTRGRPGGTALSRPAGDRRPRHQLVPLVRSERGERRPHQRVGDPPPPRPSRRGRGRGPATAAASGRTRRSRRRSART